MNKGTLRELFKKTIVEFLDSLIGIIPYDPDLIVARIYINDKTDSNNVITNFLVHFMDDKKPFKKAVENRDEAAFLSFDLKGIANVPDSTIDKFKFLWRSDSISKDNKKQVWKWLNMFINIAKKYQEAEV